MEGSRPDLGFCLLEGLRLERKRQRERIQGKDDHVCKIAFDDAASLDDILTLCKGKHCHVV